MIIVVMGVTGCGKSTVGRLLAERLNLPFVDADTYHSEENILKMSKGIPLTDEDRIPWLLKLSSILKQEEQKEGVVLACSALREVYRKTLQNGLKEQILWVLLEGSQETLSQRMKLRKQHFMSDTLLLSQLNTLEIPDYAYRFSIEKSPQEIVEEVTKHLN